MTRLPSPRLLAALLALLAVGAGCEDSVDPTLGTDQAFSVYGHLDPTADRQALRVVPIGATIGADTSRTINAEVTSVEPSTGRTVTWRDSVVVYDDGSVGHVFVADYTPAPGAVEVTVRASDGGGARVSVPVPALAQPEVPTPETTGATVSYAIGLEAPRVLDTELVYYVTGVAPAPDDTVAVAYDPADGFSDAGGGRWALGLDFLRTSRAFLASGSVPGGRPALIEVAVRAFVANEAWAVPAGGFDLDRIAEPGTFSNVAGGFGFVGAGYWTEARWTPSLNTQSRAGFAVAQDPASSLFINEVSADGWVELYNPTLEAISIGGYSVQGGTHRLDVPFGMAVGPGGFWVAEVGFTRDDVVRGSVALVSPDGERVLELDVAGIIEAELGSYGAYPDGRSRRLRELALYRDDDLFRGLTSPTPGAPNSIGVTVAVVNEVYSAGAAGWVEVYAPLGVTGVLVTSDSSTPMNRWRSAGIDGDGFGSAGEREGVLDLGQIGGEVLVAIWRRDNPPRVVDVRTYGPQAQGLSSGLVPDGDLATWQTGLLPTRGAPNAPARFASR